MLGFIHRPDIRVTFGGGDTAAGQGIAPAPEQGRASLAYPVATGAPPPPHPLRIAGGERPTGRPYAKTTTVTPFAAAAPPRNGYRTSATEYTRGRDGKTRWKKKKPRQGRRRPMVYIYKIGTGPKYNSNVYAAAPIYLLCAIYARRQY